MLASWRRRDGVRMGFVVVERDSVDGGRKAIEIGTEDPTPTTRRILRRSRTRRQMPASSTMDIESEDESNHNDISRSLSPTSRSFTMPSATSVDTAGGISRTTEHLLIAAGSIGTTIVIAMIVLGLYILRKRGLSISDVIRNGRGSGKKGGPPMPSKSGSLSTQTPLNPLAQSNSFKPDLDLSDSANKSFLDVASPLLQNSHRRDISSTPSSPLFPIQDTGRSYSPHKTRSLREDEEALTYKSDPRARQPSALPAPPTFRQFLSNRPSASQRPLPGAGGGMASRFSWTNSNAPQTPHDPPRDTALAATAIGRDSFITTRSSVPRFRTIDSWVNQQSTRIEEQRLKQQFRMTNSTTYSDGDDVVPEIPPVPQHGVPASRTTHRRNDTVDTAPIFKHHPGTEVRFSTHSTVPSEVLDMGRRNVAL
ncbi:hypothetical protein BDU57DRAFT_553592 [Ampelomyces quisqualis]|uniref:Uncharacterized protein n=1 Tax=Ampelomyces quisqualis TaxID=50730 RepID=A0A6A5R086_AMPQU|nr:hypothetical protein BDU57DRAFT_553592 [Ampelomyces quisqualis]